MFKLLTWTHILYVYATVATSSKIEVRENSKGFSLGWGLEKKPYLVKWSIVCSDKKKRVAWLLDASLNSIKPS